MGSNLFPDQTLKTTTDYNLTPTFNKQHLRSNSNTSEFIMSPSHKQRAGSKPAEALVDQGIPGTRCKVCEAKGQEVWVIPGKLCRVCGTAAGCD